MPRDRKLSWSAIQLGSREHYSIPIALNQINLLDFLFTDSWTSKRCSKYIAPFSPALSTRRTDSLHDNLVVHKTLDRILFDINQKFRGSSGWSTIIARNNWFQRWVSKYIKSLKSEFLFSYSYTARLPFRVAKKNNINCILGQIDPGPLEFVHVEEYTSDYTHLLPTSSPPSPPNAYWDDWREEVSLSDKILVNSSWSANFLVKSGVPLDKLVEIPLVYNSVSSSFICKSPFQKEFSASNPLQVLFLGSINLRKGIGHIFDAIRILKNAPIVFTFAGPIYIRLPSFLESMHNVRFLGPVDRQSAHSLYRQSDVFLFPTISDGFGLTQLEALAHGLPVISSLNCANVITDQFNGLKLSTVSPESISSALLKIIDDPPLLAFMKENAFVPDKFKPFNLSSLLSKLSNA